jgi:hypothetical protein
MEAHKMEYKTEGRDSSGNWTEDVVGNDTQANTFDSIAEAEAKIPELVAMFADNDNPPTAKDFRVVERR